MDDDFSFDEIVGGQEREASPGRTRRTSDTGPKTCAYPPCLDLAKDKARFCHSHERVLANLAYDAGLKSADQKKQFTQYTKNTDNAVRVLDENAGQQIGNKKFARRGKVSWAQWNEQHGVSLKSSEGARRTLFEKEQFILRIMRKFGRTRPEATEMWENHRRVGVKSDNFGYKGAERLWLIKEEFADDVKERFMTGQASFGSDIVKTATEEDVASLRRHALDLNYSSSSDFMMGRSTSPADAIEPAEAALLDLTMPKDAAPMEKIKKSSGSAGDLEDTDSDEDIEDAGGPAQKRRKGPSLNTRKASFVTSVGKFADSTSLQIQTLRDKARGVLAQAGEAPPKLAPAGASARNLYAESCARLLNLVEFWGGEELTPPKRIPIKKEPAESSLAGAAAPVIAQAPLEAVPAAAVGAVGTAPAKDTEEADAAAAEEDTAKNGTDEKKVESPPRNANQPRVPQEVKQEVLDRNVNETNVSDILHKLSGGKLHVFGFSNPKHFRTKTYLEQFQIDVQDIADEKTLFKKKIVWQRMTNNIGEMQASIKAAMFDCNKHVSDTLKMQEKEAKKVADQRGRDALKTQQENLNKVAKRSAMTSPGSVCSQVPCFTLVPDKYVKFPVLLDISMGDMTSPFVISAHGAVKDWQADALMQKVMTKFGSRYKKEDTFAATGKVTQPLAPKAGKEQTENMMALLMSQIKGSIIDISQISKSWMSTSWLHGYGPDYQNIALGPNSAACIRTHWFGSLDVIAVELLSLVEGAKAIGQTFRSMHEVCEFLKSMDDEAASRLSTGGVKFYLHSLSPGEAMHTPAGFIVAEQAKADQRLIFGARKSFFVRVQRSKDCYIAAKTMLAAGGADVARMDSILSIWQ